jgi:hypothetical protein
MVGQRRARFSVAIAITLWCVVTLHNIEGMGFRFKALLWLTIMGGLIGSFEAMQIWLHAPADAKACLAAFVMFAAGMFGLKHTRPSEQHGN